MSGVTVSPIPGKTFGAVVTGVSLADLSDVGWLEVEAAFLEHAVLVFPGQHLSEGAQTDFGRRFGAIEHLAVKPVAGKGTSFKLKNTGRQGVVPQGSYAMHVLQGNEVWHTDSTYTPVSSKCALLSAQAVPPHGGGETAFCDLRAAYAALPEVEQARIADLAAFHSLHYSHAHDQAHFPEVGTAYGMDGDAYLYPLVKVHPVTGRPSLFIARHAFAIPGLSRGEARRLLADLQAFALSSEERVFQHKWREGDLVLWDNRCLLHRARPYDYTEHRVMLGTRISGDPQTEACLSLPAAAASKQVLATEMALLRSSHCNITVEPIPGKTLGAVVTGVDLKQMSDNQWATIRSAFLEHGVLVFPRASLSEDEFNSFAGRFGMLQFSTKTAPARMRNMTRNGAKRFGVDLAFELLKMKHGNQGWHTDSTYAPVSSKVGCLQAKVLPEWGGNTEFLDARAAYDDLEQNAKDHLASLSAYHSNAYSQALIGHFPPPGMVDDLYHPDAFLRPLVKQHPETGRRAIFTGRHAFGIPGLSRKESRQTLVDLQAHCERESSWVYEHTWREGDLIVWDNRCLLHRARPYDHSRPRILLQARVLGEADSEGKPATAEGRAVLRDEIRKLRSEGVDAGPRAML